MAMVFCHCGAFFGYRHPSLDFVQIPPGKESIDDHILEYRALVDRDIGDKVG